MTKVALRSAHLSIIALVAAFGFFLVPGYAHAQEAPPDAAVVSAGETLFNNNCKTCHLVKKKVIGPALAGIQDRAPSVDWIKDFVRNSAKLIASGDAYANKVYEENGKVAMTAFTSFSDEQIMSILTYIKVEAEKPDAAPAVAATAPAAGDGSSISSEYLYAIAIGMIVILALLLGVLLLVASAVRRYLEARELSEADKEVLHSPHSARSVMKSSGFLFTISFVVVAVGFKLLIDNLYSIGVQQGYAPKQPIAFSHKLHAGALDIQCVYCHTGVNKSKNANIPSANICMNCHTQIRKGATTGEVEIAKVVASAEQNKPIEWVRIHNLPDLAYFNHAQHVDVGGLDCNICHGPIEEMDEVRQHSPLTMGWCVDCHRKTDVNTQGNAYYDRLLELHKSKPMKVEDIGGLECAKCHY